MTHRRPRGLSAVLIALVALGFLLAGCGGDSSDASTDEGEAPTTQQPSEDEAEDEAADDEDEAADPYAQAIEQQAAALGITNLRVEDDGTNVLVMADGTTAEQVGPACEYAATILPAGTAIATDLAGEVAPCP